MSRAEIKAKFDEIVDFAEVEKFLDTPVKFYSSGMYVRLAFAVAAHLEPEILIVDEVLAVGDAAFQKKCLGKMGDVSEKDGRTILFVSHNMAVVHNLCKSGFLLSSGQIVESGSIKTVISEYTKKMEKSSAEIQWSQENRPGNERVKLIAARIISENQVKERVDISKEITIEIILENLKHDSLFYTSIHLKDNHGNCILASVNFPSGTLIKDDLACQTLSLGELVSKCTLPKNFLNDSTYYVSILVLRHDMSVEILCEDLLQFTVIDTGEMRKEFSGHWIGFIRPKLLWQTNYL
jgi:lipopolysaccharide transport system ATP-binding protein